jgi:tRNA G26 N,N-dimethylase Trm1
MNQIVFEASQCHGSRSIRYAGECKPMRRVRLSDLQSKKGSKRESSPCCQARMKIGHRVSL